VKDDSNSSAFKLCLNGVNTVECDCWQPTSRCMVYGSRGGEWFLCKWLPELSWPIKTRWWIGLPACD